LTSTGTVGLPAGTLGAVTVTSGALTLGGPSGATGVTVTAGSLTLGGNLTVGGAFANGGTVTNNATLDVTAAGISGGGAIVNAGTIALGSRTLDATTGGISGAGTVTTTGGTISAIGTIATLTVTTGVTINAGAGLAVTNAVVGNPNFVLTGAISLSGAVGTVNNSGTLTLNGSMTANGLVTNTGTVAVGGATLTATAAGITGTGTITTTSGVITAIGTIATLTVTTGATLNGGAGLTISNAIVANPNFVLTGATSLSGAVGTVNNSGTLTLNGNLAASGATTNTGAISGAGTITFSSTYTQSAGSLTGGAGLVTFGGTVTHTGGTVTSGVGGLQFNVAYLGSLAAILAGNATGVVTFLGDVALFTYTHNSGTAVIGGTAAQTVTARSQAFSTLSVTKTGGTAATAGATSGSFSAVTFSQSGLGGTFVVAAGDTMTVTTSTTVSNGTLTLTGIYAGGGATFGVAGGTVTVATAAFAAGAMTVGSGSFTQTGVNVGAQTAASLTVSGTGNCVWDSGAAGGTLGIAGALTLTAGTLNFNHKNVNMGTGLSGAVTVWDLTIPAGVTLTPGAGTVLTVLRHLAVASTGAYAKTNNPTLVLGGATGVAGNVTDSNAVSTDLGTVVVDTQTKTMSTKILCSSLDIRNGGTLSTNAFALTVLGAVTTSAGLGTLTATVAETITVGQNFTVGAFTQATSTVALSGGTAGAAAVSAGHTFYNLTVNKGVAGDTVTPAGTLTVAGTLTLTQGTWAAGSNTLILTTGGWNSSPANFTYTPGTSVVQLNAANPTMTQKAADHFYNLTLQAGGTLASNVTVDNNFTAANSGGGGTLTMGSYTLGVGVGVNLKPGATGATLAAGTSTLALNGTGDQTVTSNAQAWFNLTVGNHTAGNTVTFVDAFTAGGTWTVTGPNAYHVTLGVAGTATNAVTFGNTGNLTISNGFAFTGGATKTTAGTRNFTGTVSAAGAGVLNFGIAGTITVPTAAVIGGTGTGQITLIATTLADGATLTLGSGAATPIATATISGTAGGTASNLTVNTTNTVSAGGAIGTDIGNLALTAGTLAMAGNGLTVSGNITRGTGVVTSTGTVTLDGTGAQAVTLTGSTLATLAVANTGAVTTSGSFTTATFTKTLSGTFTVAVANTMTVTTAFTAGAGTVTLTGPYAGSGATFAVSGGTVTAATAAVAAGAMTVSSGTFTQTGANVGAQTAVSLTVSGGSLVWDSGNAGGTLVLSGSVSVVGGSLSLRTKTVTGITSLGMSSGTLDLGAAAIASQTIAVTGGTLALGTATVSLSSAPNVVRGTSSITDTSSLITMNGAGNLSLDTANTVGRLVVAADTTLIAGGRTKNLTINIGRVLDLSAAANPVSLAIIGAGSLTATGTLRVFDSTNVASLVSQTPGTVFSYTGTDIAYNGKALTINDMNASALSTTVGGGSTVTLGSTVRFSSVTVTGASSLSLAAGLALACGDFSAVSGTTVSNSGANTMTISGDVTISGAFSTPTNSTIVMTGATKTLTASPQIGTLKIGTGTTGTASGPTATVALGAGLSLSGDLEINDEGALDVAASNVTIAGDWTNRVEAVGAATRFKAQTGTVEFVKSKASGDIRIHGNNAWYLLWCRVDGATIRFEENKTQTILAGGIFRITASDLDAGNTIKLTRYNPPLYLEDDLDWVPPAVPSPIHMWQVDLLPTANVDLYNVQVCYSDARNHPIPIPDNVSLLPAVATDNLPLNEIGNTCFKWIYKFVALNSYSEDSDRNGKIDRIRVTAETTIGFGDPPYVCFDGFRVSVTGYDIDTSKGRNGFAPISTGAMADKEFHIYLKEKPYPDTGSMPSWRILSNTSLTDTIPKYKLNTIEPVMVPCDTARPVFAASLAIPNTNQVYYLFSEPVVASGGSSLSRTDFSFEGVNPASLTTISSAVAGGEDRIAVYGASVTPAQIIGENLTTIPATVNDAAALAANYNVLMPDQFYPAPYYSDGTPPNAVVSTTHRVSDLLINVPIATAADTTYFIWPIYAKDTVKLNLSDAAIEALTPAQTAGQGIGLIRAFDGSQWLRDQDITVQARLQPALAGIPGIGARIWFDSNVSSTLTGSGGLWLPTFKETGFSGLVPYPDEPPQGRGASSTALGSGQGSNLYNFTIPASDARVASVSDLGFFFTLEPSPVGQPLYGARLDMLSGATIPANWYRLIKPFGFSVHDVALQKGGASILNNVIDPTKGEMVRLSYQLTQDGSVTITVFTLDGDVVARLANERKVAGDHAVNWNGTNLSGRPVARGIYFVRIVAPNIDEIRKVLVVRK
jgi:hypothetical protein